MENKKMIYLVTAGEYSDYHVVAAFDDRNLAEAFQSKYVPCHSDIEEFELNPISMDELKRDIYEVVMDIEGKVVHCGTTDNYFHLLSGAPTFRGTVYSRKEPRYSKQSEMVTRCVADNEIHAIKIANERRTQLIAMNQWPESP